MSPIEQVPVPLVRVVEHLDFMLLDVQPLPNGDRKLGFVTPNGDALVFAMNEKAARTLGKQLLAPRLAVADGLPKNGAGG